MGLVCSVFWFFFFSILANFGLVVLVGYNSFYKTFTGLYRHYMSYQAILGLPSLKLTVDMIFDWLEFFSKFILKKTVVDIMTNTDESIT